MNLKSRVRPNIWRCMCMSSVVLLICKLSLMLYYGIKYVDVCEFVNECMYIRTVKCLVDVSDYTCWWLGFVV